MSTCQEPESAGEPTGLGQLVSSWRHVARNKLPKGHCPQPRKRQGCAPESRAVSAGCRAFGGHVEVRQQVVHVYICALRCSIAPTPPGIAAPRCQAAGCACVYLCTPVRHPSRVGESRFALCPNSKWLWRQ